MIKSNQKEIFALYLPQYHEIPENNEWWGKGYTEWNAVRNAKPLYKGHVQPKEPLDDRYYDLSDPTGETWKWQCELAQKYGITGFGIYHYWFEKGKKLLEKPMEILLAHPEINIQYFACWANEPWRRTWYQNNNQVLMPQDYGNETEWKEHYEYLRQFFTDSRYKRIENKPVLAIYNTSGIEKLYEMKAIWNKMACEDGFDGIYILGAKTFGQQETRQDLIDGEYLFEPSYTLRYQYGLAGKVKRGISKTNNYLKFHVFHKQTVRDMENMNDLYKSIRIPNNYAGNDIFYGICPAWDNTPRKQEEGCVFLHSSAKTFQNALRKMVADKKAGSMIIINAWNEWGEGAFLEPDKENGYAYLEAIRNATNEKDNTGK